MEISCGRGPDCPCRLDERIAGLAAKLEQTSQDSWEMAGRNVSLRAENKRLREILVGVRYEGDHENPCYCVADDKSTDTATGWHEPMCTRAKAALAAAKGE